MKKARSGHAAPTAAAARARTTGPARPRVSVLLPVRDAAPFLDEALGSLVAQTRRDFEVVAVDDGSTDGSTELLARWAGRDRRIRPLYYPHRGLVPALNAGLARCRGELVARMDADDRSHRRRLERQVAALDADPSLDVVACRVEHFADGRVGEGFRVYERWLNRLLTHKAILRERFVESPLPHPSVMARRRVLLAAGGYRDMGWPEDYDLWLRLAAAGRRFGKLPEVLYAWRERAGRLTRTDPRYAVQRFLACKAHHLAAGPLRGAERVVVWGAGQTGRRLSKHLLRLGVPLVAFVDVDAAKIGRELRRRPVVAAGELPGLLAEGGRTVVLAAVPSRGARRLIRARLRRLGLRETVGFWCVA